MAFDLGNLHTPADVKKKWTRICRCSVGWLVIGVLTVAVGIILMAFFAQYWNNTDKWERGLGYAGLGLLLAGLLIFLVGLLLACALCYIVRTVEHKRNYKSQVWGPEVVYPRQPSAQPTAPPAAEPEGHANPTADIEMIEPQVKDKTF